MQARKPTGPQRINKPLPVCIGLSVFAKKRKKNLIEILHTNGLSIPYCRVLEISTELGDAVVSKYIVLKMMLSAPQNCVKNFSLLLPWITLTIILQPHRQHQLAMVEPTSILLFQHPSQENQGKEREPPQVKGTAAKTVSELPDHNVNITLAHIANKIPTPS